MRIAAVIEIGDCQESDLPVDLIEAAYRASSVAPVLLVLRPAARRAVDRALDPIVSQLGVASREIRYVSPLDDATIQSALPRAGCVVALSADFTARCEAMRIPVVSRGTAVATLLGRNHAEPSSLGLSLPDSEVNQLEAFGD